MPDKKSTYKVEVICSDVSAKLHLERGAVRERLGEPFVMSLSLYTDDLNVDLGKVLGAKLALHVATDNGERFFHGIVTDFAFTGTSTVGNVRLGHYQATVRPQLWLLGQGQRSRVFKDQKVQDILKAAFSDYGFDPQIDSKVAVKFEHAVQYRESDLHFTSRMMERYGLYYFFDHQKSKHDLKVVDSVSGHKSFGTFAYADDGSKQASEQHVTDWRASSSIRSGLYHVTGTTHHTPSTKVQEQAKSRFQAPAGSALEVYDHEATTELPAHHLDVLAQVRQEEVDAGVEEYTGQTPSLLFAVGGLFTLKGHPRDDQNKEYLLVSASYAIPGMPSQTGVTGGGQEYQVAFTAIDSKTPFRPPVQSKRPVVLGPHTALVTEETDELGRVKVRFHWGNENGELETAFARVSQNWAGKEWGGVFMPHVDHEVIVEFLDGDPDQPLVTGRVYNQENMPPLSLPGDKQKSIIRDHGGNEIVMDGTPGAQTIRIHCPKHNSTITLGKSIDLLSDSDSTNKFDGNCKTDIKGAQTTTVGSDHHVTVKGDHKQHVFGKASFKVGFDVLEALLGAQHRLILGLTSLWVGGMKKEHIIGAEWKRIDGLKRERVNGVTMKQGISKEFGSYPGVLTKIKESFVQVVKDFTINVKKHHIEAKKIRVETQEKLDKADKAKSEFKEGVFTGETHYHKPTKMFVVSSDTVALGGNKTIGLSAPMVQLCGHLEVRD